MSKVGLLQVAGDRARYYAVWAQFVMIGYTMISVTPARLVDMLPWAVVMAVVLILDVFVLFPRQLDVNIRLNPVLNELCEDVKEIKEKMK